MKMFTIEAYGGRATTDGPIAHFTVHAEDIDEAVTWSVAARWAAASPASR